MSENKMIHFEMKSDIHDRLKDAAAEEHRSISSQLRFIVEQWLAERSTCQKV